MSLDMSDYRLVMQIREDAAKAQQTGERAIQLLDHLVRQNDAILKNQQSMVDAFNRLARQVSEIEWKLANLNTKADRIEAQLSPAELDKSSLPGLKN